MAATTAQRMRTAYGLQATMRPRPCSCCGCLPASRYTRFWKLAVPDWRGRHPRDWVPDSLSEAIGRGQDRRILALVQCFVTAGAIEQLIEAITGPRAMADLVSAFPETFGHPLATELSGDRELADNIERTAETLVADMPSELRRLIVHLSRAAKAPE